VILMNDWKKKKAAIYLRRSKGEGGSTKAQLERIKKQVNALVKAGKIQKVDFAIVGKDIDKKVRFKADRDLKLTGDVFNDGEGASAFSSAQKRPALNEMLRRMREGQYDVVLAESLDRYSRDPLDFATVALDLWREDKKVFWGISDGRGYGTLDPFNEAIITTQLMWAGEGKKQESGKAISALDAKLDRGFITSRLKAQFLGSGTKNEGLDYRRFWRIAQGYGENDKGNLNSPTTVGREFKQDHTWAKNTYQMFKEWNTVMIKDDLTALDAWFNTVDAVNEFIVNQPSPYNKVNYKSGPVQNLISNSNGFINYPAGFSASDKYKQASQEFINFPYPLDFSFQELAMTNKPQIEIPGWAVQRIPISKSERENLLKYQTQFRSGK
jgi:hypothetical protein